MLDGTGTIAFEWSSVGLALLFVLLRLYVRVCIPEGRHDWTDYIVVVAWLNFAACCACDVRLRALGLMESDATYTGDMTKLNLNPEKNIEILKITYVSMIPYLIDLWLIKAGILSFYYTIIPKNSPIYRLFLHFIAGFCVVTFMLAFIGNMFWCIPIKRNWSLNIDEICKANATPPPYYGAVASTIATDLMIFCFPFPLLRGMALSRRKMIGVILVFMLGSLTILASICRIIAIYVSSTFTTVIAWSAVECSTGIMVVCVPALRFLVLRRETHTRPPRDKPSPRFTGPLVLTAADRNEIWDGSDASAPEWIRMASLPSANSIMISPKSAQFDDSVDSALSRQLAPPSHNSADYGSAMCDFSMVTAVPNLRLQIGRGIIEHASISPPISPSSVNPLRRNLASFPSSISTMDGSSTEFIRLDDQDDVLPWSLNRWDTGESGRLELGRIVETMAGVDRPISISVSRNERDRLGILNPNQE